MTFQFQIYYRFTEFQNACSYKLVQFSHRVSAESITFHDNYSLYPPWHFDFFEEMWSKMSQEERRRNYRSTVLLYQRLLINHARGSRYVQEMVLFLRRTFTPLLRLAQNISSQMVSYLVRVCKEALDVETGVFLRIVSREDLSVVLECFPTHRFNGWGIQNSQALMRIWRKVLKLRCIPLIQYGFPYLFDDNYFRGTLRQMIWEGVWSPKVNGKMLSTEISFSIFHYGNLRMQLAVDLLLHLFDDVTGRNQIILLDRLWKAMPFPYISYAEMFTLLKPFFKGKHLSLQEVCDEYKKCNFIFEVPEVSEPRTLEHLCRVQIRKSLCEANTISDETIDSLEEIPPLLRDYLKLTYPCGKWYT